MAGVVSANVVLVALTSDVLHAGARGLGYLNRWMGGSARCTASRSHARMRQELRLAVRRGVCRSRARATRRWYHCDVFLVAASLLQGLFGFCRALGGVVAQSALMSIVPRHFMGRTQSAMAIVTTAVQLAMCVALGWIAERAGIIAGYTLLALLYAGATLTAFHARQLLRVAADS
jgi:hypothetical protein